ncbi:MAG: DNA topoisomerase I [Desulfobacteraceae bacterium]
MNDMSYEFIRDQLDEILANEITSLIDVDSGLALMSYNVATIACIHVVVEREREIKQYQEAPPERYTLQSLENELGDIGLQRDEQLTDAIDSVVKRGYIRVDEKNELMAEVSAYTMVAFLDNMFPGMQGLNLIAFVLQINEEVLTERKTLDQAREVFAKTLKNSGVKVTREKAEKEASRLDSKKLDTGSKEVARKLKKENISRLSKLFKRKKGDKTGQGAQESFKVKDVFDKGPTKEELDKQKQEFENAEKALREAEIKARELSEREEKVKEAEEAAREAEQKAKELEGKEKELKALEEAAKEAEKKEQALREREAEMAAREAELKEMEERLKARQEEYERLEEKERAESPQKEISRDDEDIEARISALSSELEMPCPLCETGKVKTEQTGKGKTYYACSDAECRFVSWDMPYHFQCPMCKSPYLIEFAVSDNEKGLKCPRAACSYQQKNLFDPAWNMAQAAKSTAEAAPKKKKKVVRRKKRS